MIYILKNDEQQGPMEESVLSQCLSAGIFLDTDLIWKEGMEEWVPISKYLEAQDGKALPPVIPTPPPLPIEKTQPATCSSYLIVGRVKTWIKNHKLAPNRNLDIYDPNTGLRLFHFEEVNKSEKSVTIRKQFVDARTHSPFNVQVSRENTPLGTLKGLHSCRLYGPDNKIIAYVERKNIFNSGTMFIRCWKQIFALFVLSIVLLNFFRIMVSPDPSFTANPIVWGVVGSVYGVLFLWVVSRKVYRVYNKNFNRAFEINAHKDSKKKTVLYCNDKPVCEIKRIKEKEMEALIGDQTESWEYSESSNKLADDYREESSRKPMKLREKIRRLSTIAKELGKETIEHVRSIESVETTHSRLAKFSEPLKPENVEAFAIVAYLIFVTHDCNEL